MLSDIDHADHSGDILKHPVCESFLHLKWLLIRKVIKMIQNQVFAFLLCLLFVKLPNDITI